MRVGVGAKRAEVAAADVDEFIRVVRSYDRDLRMLVERLVGGSAVMDDVLQEAYLKAFRSLGSFRRRAALRTWLYRIVYNACIDELRRPRLVQVPLSSAPVEAQAPADQDGLPTRMALAEALAELPVQQRAAVLLVDAQGLSYRETAEVLDAPEGTIATWVSRGRSNLRRALTNDDEAVPR